MRDAELVPERRDQVQDAEEREDGDDGEGLPRLDQRPEGDLGHGDREGGDPEPFPALPRQDRRRGRQSDREETERADVFRRVEQHGREERAEDAEARDRARVPAQGEEDPERPRSERAREGERQRDEAVEGRRGREGEEETCDPGSNARERRLRLPAAFVEPGGSEDERPRAEQSERDAKPLVDPPAVDPEGDEEDEPDHDREPADQREQASTEQLLEIGGAARREADRRGRGWQRPGRFDPAGRWCLNNLARTGGDGRLHSLHVSKPSRDDV